MKFVRIIFAASVALFMAMSSCQESPVVDDPDNNGGTITVTELGNGVWRYEADLVSWFGETMFVEFEGVPDPLVYYVM